MSGMLYEGQDRRFISYVMPGGNNYNQRLTVHPWFGISRTVMGCGHSGNEPKVIIKRCAISEKVTNHDQEER